MRPGRIPRGGSDETCRGEQSRGPAFGLSTLVQLVKRARHAATAQELAFVMVNETHALVPYRQAVLWRRDAIGGSGVVAISGGAVVERNAPITLWPDRAMAKRDSAPADTPRAVSAADLNGALARSQHGLQSMIPGAAAVTRLRQLLWRWSEPWLLMIRR